MKVWLLVIILLSASCSSTKHTRKKYQPAKPPTTQVIDHGKKDRQRAFLYIWFLFMGGLWENNK